MVASTGTYDLKGTTNLKPGKWYHVAMTYGDKKITAYLDGKLDGSMDASGKIVARKGNLRIGRGEPASYFNRIIDEMELFSSVLTEGEIAPIMGLKLC